MIFTLETLTADQAELAQPELITLLQDSVAAGASIGFVNPLSDDLASQYWREVVRDIHQRSHVLIALRDSDRIVGSVQLGLCMRSNGLHRAEVQKLLVHTTSRRRGFGRALMVAIEQEARNAKRSLLYLDTESHQPAEMMYRKLGWLLVGEIPDYASSPDGNLHGTMIFYKKIAA